MGNIRKVVEFRTIDADNLRKACIDFSWCDCTSGEYEELFDIYTNVELDAKTLNSLAFAILFHSSRYSKYSADEFEEIVFGIMGILASLYCTYRFVTIVEGD